MLEEVLFGADDPVRAIGRLCVEELGAGIDDVLFRGSSVGFVLGVRLADGRAVVVKVHRWRAAPTRLAAVREVQAGLAAAGVPVPVPLAGPVPVGAGTATVETFLPGGSADARRPVVRAAMAEALHALVAAGRRLVRSELGHAALNRDVGAPLWPEPHGVQFDFAASTAGAEWIDELAHEATERFRGEVLPDVVGHLDWRAENLGFDGDRVVAIYDCDSLGLAPEPFVVGNAMGQFSTHWTAGGPVPTLAEMLAFVADYEVARGRPFDERERRVLDAANLYHLAYSARCEHSNRVLGFGTSEAFADLLRARGRNLPDAAETAS